VSSPSSGFKLVKREIPEPQENVKVDEGYMTHKSLMQMLPREALFSQQESLSIELAKGRIGIAYALDAPSPTLVLESPIPLASGNDASAVDRLVRSALHFCDSLVEGGFAKVCVISPRSLEERSLNFLFGQRMSKHNLDCVYSANCGHSMLAAASVAASWFWNEVPPVSIHNIATGSVFNISLEKINGSEWFFSINYSSEQLPFFPWGEPISSLSLQLPNCNGIEQPISCSYLEFANPYLFVDARSVGIYSLEGLFCEQLSFELPQAMQHHIQRLEGIHEPSPFPKVALVLSHPSNSAAERVIALRSITVEKWHPSLAMSGLFCVAAASLIEGSVVNQALHLQKSEKPHSLSVVTPGGTFTVCGELVPQRDAQVSLFTSVKHKKVRLITNNLAELIDFDFS
jgi:2-methylaconitate cis-trans-isomerase PrpF